MRSDKKQTYTKEEIKILEEITLRYKKEISDALGLELDTIAFVPLDKALHKCFIGPNNSILVYGIESKL